MNRLYSAKQVKEDTDLIAEPVRIPKYGQPEKARCLIGKKIRIINMNGEPYYTGRIGTVTDIDDIGQIHGTWGGLAIIDGEDEYRVIDD